MCAHQGGHRITTTTIGMGGLYVAEPATGRLRHPRLTARQALARFERIYGRLKPRDRRTVQVRYGVITASEVSTSSGNAIGGVPNVRRVPGWMITDCRAVTRPHDDGMEGVMHHRGRPGVLIFALADRFKPFALDWDYEYTGYHGESYGTGGSQVVVGADYSLPAARSTHYLSVPWTFVKSRHHRRQVLISYQPRRCYSLDHVNAYEHEYPHDGAKITVILSTGPHGSCARPAGIAPYMEVDAIDGRFGRLRHGRTGAFEYTPGGHTSPCTGPNGPCGASSDPTPDP